MKKLLSDEMIKQLNFRITEELKASRIYRDMYVWLNINGYINIAKLYKKWSEEELEHMEKAENYLLKRNIKPVTGGVESFDQSFKSLMELFEKTLEYEILVEEQCKKFSMLAFKEGDITTFEFASFYLKEQVEEIDKIQTLIDALKISTDCKVFDHNVEYYL